MRCFILKNFITSIVGCVMLVSCITEQKANTSEANDQCRDGYAVSNISIRNFNWPFDYEVDFFLGETKLNKKLTYEASREWRIFQIQDSLADWNVVGIHFSMLDTTFRAFGFYHSNIQPKYIEIEFSESWQKAYEENQYGLYPLFVDTNVYVLSKRNNSFVQCEY